MFAAVTTLTAFGMMFSGFIGAMVVAFGESAGCGLMFLFVPGYLLYYAITRREKALEWLNVYGGGVLMVMIAAALIPVLNTKHGALAVRGAAPSTRKAPIPS